MSMRRRRILLGLVCIASVILGCVLFRQPVFNALVSYEREKLRPLQEGFARNSPVHDAIREALQGHPQMSEKDLIRQSLRITDQAVSFTFSHTDADVNVLVKQGKANCVGYAAIFALVLNEMAQAVGHRRLHAKHVVGKVHVLGINIHRFFTNSFLVDHDYDVVEGVDSRGTHVKYVVDPSLHDYLHIDFVRER